MKNLKWLKIAEYVLYHIVLENDDISKHYGIYVNDGILSESCSEKSYIKKYGYSQKNV